jgi:hypothetical protein
MDEYSSPNIVGQTKSRRMRWAGHVACTGEGRKVYSVMVGKPKGKRPLGKPRRRWENGIRIDLREIGWGCRLDSVGSGLVAGSCKYGGENLGSGATDLVTYG